MEVQGMAYSRPGRGFAPGNAAALAMAGVGGSAEIKLDEQSLRNRTAALAEEISVNAEIKVEVAHDETTGSGVVRIFSADGSEQLCQFPPSGVLSLSESLHDFSAAASGSVFRAHA